MSVDKVSDAPSVLGGRFIVILLSVSCLSSTGSLFPRIGVKIKGFFTPMPSKITIGVRKSAYFTPIEQAAQGAV